MITEDYVSFEVAKLLKEKGFDEPTLAYAYGQDMIAYYSQPRVTDDYNVEAGRYPLPTLQMAMKWLRKVKNIDCTPYLLLNKCLYTYIVIQIGTLDVLKFCHENYYSYEEACEAAIKYCLENLI